jgi:branched-chain amino acid transport system ATP-binding protein
MLEINDMTVCYGPVPALRGVSMTVGDGEMVALVGANGAGKTTTLRTVSGMLSPAAGSITFDGERIDGLPSYKVIRHGVAHLPEGRALFSDMSVIDNLRLGAWTQPNEKGFRRRAAEVMDHFPILRERSKQAAGTLSGGEQQMLGVARALMSEPRLLIVDELSLGLAPKMVLTLLDTIQRFNAEQGTACLLVEQAATAALKIATSAYLLQRGEVVYHGSAARLRDDVDVLHSAYLGQGTARRESALRR